MITKDIIQQQFILINKNEPKNSINLSMQQQLARIRNKDYSKIDEQLYTNIGITSQLDCTLAQLAQLQRYLKSQIDSIQDSNQKEVATMKASKVVMAIRQDGQSRCVQKCGCRGQFQVVLEKVRKIGRSFKNSREAISRQINSCIADITQQITDSISQQILTATKKSSQNSKLKSQIVTLQRQISELRQKNVEMVEKLEEWQKAQQRCRQKIYKHTNSHTPSTSNLYPSPRAHQTGEMNEGLVQYKHHRNSLRDLTSVYTETQSLGTDRISFDNNGQFKSVTLENQQTEHQQDIPRIPMPLRRQSRQNSQSKYGTSAQKAILHQSNSIKQFETLQTKKCQTAKLCYSNGIMNESERQRSPMNRNRQKENELLKLKGTDLVNRKSTKKLKLFSLI